MEIKITTEIKIKNDALPQVSKKSISLLLGSGFSMPMGYPLAKDLNQKLLEFDKCNVDFGSSGKLFLSDTKANTYPNNGNNSYQVQFKFCKELIKKYNEAKGFDYEQFYDYIYYANLNELNDDELYNQLLKEYSKEKLSKQFYGLTKIYSQMVEYLIKDSNGNNWYDTQTTNFNNISKYDNFLAILKAWSNDCEINVHTLNHDLLFEAFNMTNLLHDMISDGFSDNCSEYYGKVSSNNCENMFIRLEKHIRKYVRPIHLYKLHGSLDYVIHQIKNERNFLEKKQCVKIKKNMYPDDVYLCTNEGFENDPFIFHSEFLTGSTSKILRYNDIFYRELFFKFKKNLQKADKLIIIGYGFKDKEINSMILENYDYENKKLYIIDPSLPKLPEEFTNINHEIINKSIEDITDCDLE